MFDAIFIDQCKYNPVPTQIIESIMRVESAKKPYAININHKGVSLVSYSPKSKEAATKIAKKYIKKGYTVDIGLMQINSANLKTYNKSVEDILDPCTNINVASKIYYNFFKSTAKNLPFTDRTKKALSAYNTGSYTQGFKNGYVAKYSAKAALKNVNVIKQAKFLLALKFPSNLTLKLSSR